VPQPARPKFPPPIPDRTSRFAQGAHHDQSKLERAGKIMHRLRLGDYRVYFERHKLGVVAHRILNRNTLRDFLFRSSLPVGEDKALQENPKFWEMIEGAAVKNPSKDLLLGTAGTEGAELPLFTVVQRHGNTPNYLRFNPAEGIG
jgi:hypothetical protein